jgi:hypothetical protein
MESGAYITTKIVVTYAPPRKSGSKLPHSRAGAGRVRRSAVYAGKFGIYVVYQSPIA